MDKTVAYLRRSTNRQEQSIEDQRRFILARASELGYTVVKSFTDDAVSGASAENRGQFQEMIRFVESSGGEIKAVLCYDISRFGRTDTDEAGYYRYRLKKVGCEVIYVAENLPDSRAGDLLRDVKQWQKREHLVDLSRDTARGLVSVAEKGFSTGRRAPYGYDRMLLDKDGNKIRRLRDKEAVRKEKSDKVTFVSGDPFKVEVVREIFRLADEEQMGIRKIAAILNSRRIPSPNGGKWSTSTLRFLLHNPAYKGSTVYNRRTMGKFHSIRNGKAVERSDQGVKLNPKEEWIIREKAHQALVSPEIFDRVQKRLDERSRACNGYRMRSNYLLSGLVLCRNCGNKMSGMRKTRQKRNKNYVSHNYVCSGYLRHGRSECTHNSIERGMLEDYVLAQLRKEMMPERVQQDLRNGIAAELTLNCDETSDMPRLIRKRIRELDKKIKGAFTLLTEENRQLINNELNALAEEKKALEYQLSKATSKRRLATELDKAIDEAASLVSVLGQEKAPEAIPLLKDVIRRLVSGISLTFRPKKVGKKIVNVLQKGTLEIRSAAAYVGSFVNTGQCVSPRLSFARRKRAMESRPP